MQAQTQTNTKNDTISSETLDEVLVQAVRATNKTPIAYSNLSKEELAKRNLGQDIPVLMNFMPSVVTTTDAGNGVGYTGIRVRGSDGTRINVTINGIPYNDAESHGSFWVNMPDFVSSVENLQLQRGVGTSTNGSGAFGASLNLLTDKFSYDANGEIANSIGSFNTRKHTAKFSTGLVNNTFELTGRLSNLYSDGYIDRASSKLNSYFLQGTFINEGTLLKALVFGGNEKTYQAWNGLEQKDIDKYGRRFNTSGMYYDNEGNMQFYDNETDNYKQDHYQLHWNEKWNSNWNSNVAVHYTKGFGYFENYKVDEDLADYNILPIAVNDETNESSDLIRRKYLDNQFYGVTFSAQYNKDNLEVLFGGAANRYENDHFGEVLWVRSQPINQFKQKYYSDYSTKNDVNGFLKASYIFNEQWILFGDLQLRNVAYKANGNETGLVNDTFNFFNPKAGITYKMNDSSSAYFSYARANREPNRSDYENGNPRPEKLNDFELGWRYASQKLAVNVNGYYMLYKDQLVLTGALNDVGAALRENSGNSYRLGIEIDGSWQFAPKWLINPNITLSSNKNIDYKAQIDGSLVHLGNTNISFSPNVIVGNALTFSPVKQLNLTWLTKFVGEQYMGNTDSDASKLDSYLTNDINVVYEMPLKKWFQSVSFNLLANNIFNVKYISNGYYYTYDDDWSNPGNIITREGAGYYPQAQFNILGGVTLKF
ncbi:TonB-dependent receptor [Flavobacterium sp. CBA20B-1]|nr:MULTISPECIES: TonB-dependent receptor [unclassified Flavobacterium]WCM43511.1 TonB-dependent receptor [Flavobacterium sp. CBA20B-1]